MKNQRLDEFIRGKLEEKVQPPAHLWSRIEESLDKNIMSGLTPGKTKKNWFGYYGKIAGVGMAASLLAAVALFMLMSPQEGENDQHIAAGTDVQKGHGTHTSSPQVYVPGDYPDRQPVNRTAHHDYHEIIQQNQLALNEAIRNFRHNNQVAQPAQTITDLYTGVSGILRIDEEAYGGMPIAGKDTEEHHEDEARSAGTVTGHSMLHNDDKEEHKTVGSVLIIPDLNDMNIAVRESDKNYLSHQGGYTDRDNKKSVISLGGGYNYGTLDHGYALTLSTKKDINSKWFIEGNMGFVFNEAGDNQIKYGGDYLALRKDLKSGLNTVAMEARFYNPSDYLFLQMNPVFGYKVSPRFNVGMGPDYQQLVTNLGQDIVYFPVTSSGRLLPRSDFGVLGKAEYRFSQRVKAGVIYREGVTSILKNNNSSIHNRSYLQFQLNYILHK